MLIAAMLGLLVSACGVDVGSARFRERMNDRALRMQVALEDAVEGPKTAESAEIELGEELAVEQAEALAKDQALENARIEDEQKAAAAAARTQANPLAGAPADQLSSQLRP